MALSLRLASSSKTASSLVLRVDVSTIRRRQLSVLPTRMLGAGTGEIHASQSQGTLSTPIAARGKHSLQHGKGLTRIAAVLSPQPTL